MAQKAHKLSGEKNEEYKMISFISDTAEWQIILLICLYVCMHVC